MVDKELIEIWRNMLKPSISSRLLKTNYEGKGEQDKEEFERDFDEILDLALTGLKYKAQLSQEGTTTDTISRQAAVELAMKYCPDDDGAVQCDGDIRGLLDELENLPPAQPEQTKMIKEIRKWVNSKNRGSGDYFIVDKIEEIINKYE